jgi:hypothetical protein
LEPREEKDELSSGVVDEIDGGVGITMSGKGGRREGVARDGGGRSSVNDEELELCDVFMGSDEA